MLPAEYKNYIPAHEQALLQQKKKGYYEDKNKN